MTTLTLHTASELVKQDTDLLIKTMMGMEQADCPVMHYFHDGVYIREVRFPAGALVVGHIQRFAQMNVFIQGSVRMMNQDGSSKVLEAPMTFVAPAGRKTGYVLEDVIWQNIYPNSDNCQDIEALEAKWLETTPYFEEFKATKLLTGPDDYEQMLSDLGVTAEQVEAESKTLEDVIYMPYGWNKVAVRSSPIHGQGVFAEANVVAGEMFCPARIEGKRTPAGRYTNHSGTPNTKAVLVNGSDIGWVALRDIHGRRGGFNGEEVTVDYRQVYSVAREKQQ
jgi:hypothetical protein